MKRANRFASMDKAVVRIAIGVFLGSFFTATVPAQSTLNDKALSMVAILLVGDGEGVVTRIAPAIAIKKEGVFLVPNHLLKDAKELQIRLKSGEIFDDVSLIGADERRDIAAIRIDGADISTNEPAGSDDLRPGENLILVTHSPGKLWFQTNAKLTGTKLADEIEGAGQGFRAVQFDGELNVGYDGGVLFTESGVPVALATREITAPVSSGFAVPISSVKGLANGDRRRSFGSGKALAMPTATSLKAARNPSSDPKELFINSKKVFVNSRTTFFKEQQLINELNKRKEIKDWGWVLIADSWESRNKADMVIELDHQILTFDFTFTVTHRRSSVVITAGKVIIADGASGASKMVDKIIKSLSDVVDPKPKGGK